LDKQARQAASPPRSQVAIDSILRIEDVDEGIKLHLEEREVLLRIVDGASRMEWREKLE